jgi:exodeoxyribonuclease VII large subunit
VVADLFAFCDEALCRTVALLRVPVIASVGHHTDRTLIDDVSAVCCSTPTHAAEVAVPIDCGAARSLLSAYARRLQGNSRRAVVDRARVLAQLSKAPAQHVARHRRHLHQLLRELRASANRTGERGRSLASVQMLVLGRTAARAQSSERVKRRSDLERLRLALAAHDPDRTLARGYVLAEDRDGEPVASAGAARSARELRLRFHDGVVAAQVEEAEQ